MLTVATHRVTCTGARRCGGRLPPVEVTVVYAKEWRPPKGEEALEWLLLTSLPVEDFPSACTLVRWYGCRWEIAVCQSQPIKLSWCPLRLLAATIIYLRGLVKREDIVDINLLPRDDDFFNQTLSDSLAVFEREAV